LVVVGLKEQSNNDFYRIQDIKGSVLSKSNLTVANGKINQQVDISALPSGIYFVTISVAGKNSTHKIIKE
jgi:YbbR domain-containing protein